MKKLRILSLLMCLLMLLSGCAVGGNEAESSDTVTEQTEATETEPIVENIDLVVDNKARFVIVSRGEDYAPAAESLRTLLQGKTGVKFDVKKFDPSPDEGGKIYVGCDWCEVTGSEEAPKYGYYGVAFENGNVYVCGSTATEVAQCVSVFASSITKEHITKDDQQRVQVSVPQSVLFLKEPDGGKDVTLLDASLKKYRIVYSANACEVETYFVTLLQEELRRIGYDVKAVTDEQTPSEREIVVGSTTRAGSKDFYSLSRKAGEYAIFGRGTSLYIGYGSVLCLLDVLADIPQVYGKSNVNISKTVSGEYHINKTNESDIRVMTANIQFVNWDAENKDYNLRMRMTAEYFELYHPDFIGMQEAIEAMRTALTPYLPECYKYVDFSKYTDEMYRIEYLPVLYDAEKWTVLDAGTGDWEHALFTAWGYDWVKFGRIGNESEVFYLINLHYMPAHFLDKEGYGLAFGELYRRDMAGYVSEEVKRIIAEDPDAMIAITGDYNSDRRNDVFEAMYENGYLETSSMLTEDTNMTLDWKLSTVDHISVTKDNTEVVLHRHMNTIGGEFMSDHYYAFCDLRPKTQA